MVKAKSLSGNHLVEAMREGAFYASSGVYLEKIDYDSASRTLHLKIRASEGVSYTTQLIGTRKGYQSEESGGRGFEEQKGVEVSLKIPNDAFYARATITSDRQHPNPSFDDQLEQAWIQPVGWEVKE